MTNPNLTQSQKRYQESLAPFFVNEAPSEKKCIFLKSSTDIGVMRNGGRNGARFAPQSFLSTFKKFALTEALRSYTFPVFEVSDEEEERRNFPEAQEKEALRIRLILEQYPNSKICHLGGGHDHAYPLLKALSFRFKRMIIVNIDAHADTRTDLSPHSGTPFRQIASEFSGELSLYQIGLHPFANSLSTLSILPQGSCEILWKKDMKQERLKEIFKAISEKIDDQTVVVFSLDADALSGHEVPGVSAVNPNGISRNELSEIWSLYNQLPLHHPTVLGIYELNPLYDSLASISMRTLGSFVYDSL